MKYIKTKILVSSIALYLFSNPALSNDHCGTSGDSSGKYRITILTGIKLSSDFSSCEPQEEPQSCAIGDICNGLFVVDNASLRDLVAGNTVIANDGTEISSYADTVIDTSQVSDMSNLFNSLNPSYSISNWNTQSVNTMEQMFILSTGFNQNLNSWNVSNVVNMQNMFNMTNNFNQPLNNWNVNNVDNMRGMFSWAMKFNQDLSMWNVNSVNLCNYFSEWGPIENTDYMPNFTNCDPSNQGNYN